MKTTHPKRVLLLILTASLGAGCASSTASSARDETGGVSAGGGGGDDQTRYVNRGLDAADRSVGADNGSTRRAAEQRAPVLVEGTAIGWDTLQPLLAEAAGRVVVEEAVLDKLLEAECRRQGVTITQADLQSERTSLIDALRDTQTSSSPDTVQQLVARVRAQRGLGPERWRALLQRNAMLRALVRDAVTISEEAVVRTHELLYGPDYPARIIVTPTARDAARAIERINTGESFGEVAAAISTDPSADRGGIIDPINPSDPSWPQAIRRIVAGLNVGTLSDPILLEEGYAVLWLERAPAPKHVPTVGAVRPELERLVRLEQERLLMQREARRLLGDANIAVLDQSLEWSRTSER